MSPTYLFEAGSTKTTLLIHNNGKTVEHELPGFNPNRYSEEFENELKVKFSIEPNPIAIGSKIYFYGSGLVEEENKKIVKELIYTIFKVTPIVYDDVTGAARSLLGDQPGLVAIMGTGGVAAFYDGKKIVKRNGGYGYLLDDYGGGLELGKIFISKWLNEDLPKDIEVAMSTFIKTSKQDFILELYRKNDLKILASVVQIIPQFLNDVVVNKIVAQYFNTFFERHVATILPFYPSNTMAIVGSIGLHFREIIEAQGVLFGLKEFKFIDRPAQDLIDYHLKKG